MVGDLKSTAVLGIDDGESTVVSVDEGPLLVGLPMGLPDNQLVFGLGVFAGVEGEAGVFGANNYVFFVRGR